MSHNKINLQFSDMIPSKKGGIKYDDGKLRYDLIPPEVLEELAKIYTFGANKYGDDNWKSLSNPDSRFYAALIRHIQEFRKGIMFDEESTFHHLSHALWNISALLWISLNTKKLTNE